MSKVDTELKRLVNYFSKGNVDRAVKTAKNVIKRYPNQPLPHNILGVIASNKHDFKSAVTHYQRALRLEKGYPDAWNNLGAAYSSLGEHKKAQQAYLYSLKVGGKNAEVFFNLGNSLRLDKNYTEAVVAFEAAIDQQPAYAEAEFELGRCHGILANQDAALAHFRHANELDPTELRAPSAAGDILMRFGQYRDAIAFYDQAIAQDPDFFPALAGKATALLNLGEREAAALAMEDCLKLSPEDPAINHLIHAARGEDHPVASEKYIVDIFDDYADAFDTHLVQVLGYRAPEALRDLFLDHCEEKYRAHHMVDLGCGTGLAGKAFSELCDRQTGIDLSSKMLEICLQNAVYTTLVEGEIVTSLEDMESTFDLVIAADSLVYFGDIEPLSRAIASKAMPGAFILLSTETSTESGYSLLESGRYAHSQHYVEEVFGEAGFSLLERRRSKLRQERGEWILGDYYLFKFNKN